MNNMQTHEIEDANENSDDLSEGIFGNVTYEAESPQKKEFLPWHRPRKQFVRRHQWFNQILSLVKETRAIEERETHTFITPSSHPEIDQLDGAKLDFESASLPDRTLNYLGLPGDDLLDLRFFHDEICEPHRLKLKFLGFNTSAQSNNPGQTNFNVSYDEVKKLKFVHPLSYVIGDDFCKLVTNHMAWTAVESHGPYDVVNLDLCDGFGVHEPQSRQDTYYNAVGKLLGLQARYNKPWLFLLTTRVGQNDINQSTLDAFLELYLANLNGSEKFKAESISRLNISDEETLNLASRTEKGLLEVFLVSLSKWLIKIALGLNPPWKIEIKSTIGYRVVDTNAHEDLISISFKFIPVKASIVDALGLVQLNSMNINEADQAVHALRRVSNRKDVDQILKDDSMLSTVMEDETASLLELARYNISEYRTWVQAGCPNLQAEARHAG